MQSVNSLTLITLTADRPEAFELCKCYGRRAIATLEAHRMLSTPVSVQWIVVDTGAVAAQPDSAQQYYRGEPIANGNISFLTALAVALRAATGDVIAFVEDDDYYSAGWLARVVNVFETRDIDAFGIGEAYYYHVRRRAWYQHSNKSHASLCSTAISSRLLWAFQDLVDFARSPFVDMDLWHGIVKTGRGYVAPGCSIVVGIKGMPGKTGLGAGHRSDWYRHEDPDGSFLQTLIGADADAYLKYGDNYHAHAA
jgi:glycosyltransferase involved in cell wall biosynthesis